MSNYCKCLKRGINYFDYSPAIARFLNGNDPYSDLEEYTAKLDKLQIHVRKKPNAQGNKVTGRAWFYGRCYTFGVNSYADMIFILVYHLNQRSLWHHDRQVAKRRRYREQWEEEHPGETFPWLKQHQRKDGLVRLFIKSA